MNFQPKTVAQAAPDFCSGLGLSWRDNRTEALRGLNLYRNLLYNWYQHTKLFDTVMECFRPQRFHNPCTCHSWCERGYYGITLPRNMAGVVDAWDAGIPFSVEGRWREAFIGKDPYGTTCNDLVQVSGTFPTERELPRSSKLVIYAESRKDNNQQIILHVVLCSGEKVKMSLCLKGGGSVMTEEVIRDITQVILPSDLTGGITLADENGYELSRYSPKEHIPAYVRYRAPDRCPGNILVQGTAKFVDVHYDTDIVEIGDSLVLASAGRYFRYWESKSQSELAIAELAQSRMKQNVDGLIARQNAGAKKQPVRRVNPSNALPGYH